MKYVPGYGNPSAKLMLVGEAPGGHEEEQGIPFVGPSGAIVDNCLIKAGIDPSEIYKTNVVKIRPPNNEIRRLEELHTKVEDFLPQLWKEIEEINPNCILAVGNTALKYLTGETGIKNFRGSILPNLRSVLPKVVGTMHPASLMHGESEGGMTSFRDLTFIEFDFKRAAEQSLFRELNIPARTLHIAQNSRDLIRFWDRHVGRGFRKFTSDIETSKAIPMCIGFAFNRFEAISVPLLNIESASNPTGWPLHDLAFAWKLIGEWLMDTQYNIIGQNWKFDQGRLTEIALPSRNPWFDTSIAWHTIYGELPKKLAFIASVITEEPYYKDELEEYNPRKDKLDKRLKYNAKDCAVTFEVYEKELELLEELNLTNFFFDRMMPLHDFYFRMEQRGIKIDLTERKRLIKKYDRYTRMIHRQLERDLGYELNVMSPKQVATTLFGDLKCPVRKDTGEETLEMLMLNAVKDDKRKRIIKNILKERKSRKTEGTYVKSKLHPDGRARTIFNICGAETGRTSTSKCKAPITPEPMGFAFQTLTKHGDVGTDLCSMFTPDPGKILVEADLSQAESRVVALCGNDDAAFAMMNKTVFKRNKYRMKDDIHTWTSMLVTGLDFENVTEEDRQLGKHTRHAAEGGAGKRRLSLLCGLSEWKAGRCLEKFHDACPNIRGVYFPAIIQALQDNDKVLKTPYDRRLQFFDRWGEELFKQGYRNFPQSIVSDHLKFAAMRVEKRLPYIEMLSESHDAFLAQIPPEALDEFKAVTKEEMEVPIDFSRCSIPRGCLVIPCEIKIGIHDWAHMK